MRCVTISVTSDDVFDFVAEQLEAHDYVSNPAVYDTDEEYVAVLLYALGALQLNPMSPAGAAQLARCKAIITNYLTYPSPSYKSKVLEAALFTESIFEFCKWTPVSTLFTKYIDHSYPLCEPCLSLTSSNVRKEAYRCLARVLLGKEESPTVWASSFSWILTHALKDPNPSVPVAFIHYLIDPQSMSPFTPITEHYLNASRAQRFVLPNFEEKSDDGFILAERIWSALGHESRYNAQLRKLLFILYKHLFGVDIPKVYDMSRREIGIVKLSFDGTPLDLYPDMVNMIYIDKGKETPIIERERRVGRCSGRVSWVDSRLFRDNSTSIKVRVNASSIHRY